MRNKLELMNEKHTDESKIEVIKSYDIIHMDSEDSKEKHGITIMDTKLNNNEKIITSLLQNNGRPTMYIIVHGYRIHNLSNIKKGINILLHTSNSKRRKITDFKIKINLTNLILEPQTIYLKETSNPLVSDEVLSVDLILDRYIKNENSSKELEITKEVEWDYEKIKTTIYDNLRSKGYTNTIKTKFEMDYQYLNVVPKLSLINKVKQLFCCFNSCTDDSKFIYHLVSMFKMSMSEQEWIDKNIENILAKATNTRTLTF